MGTRQYGDAATLAKKQSKMVKVVSTTSAKLGVRVGGMQVSITNKRASKMASHVSNFQFSRSNFPPLRSILVLLLLIY